MEELPPELRTIILASAISYSTAIAWTSRSITFPPTRAQFLRATARSQRMSSIHKLLARQGERSRPNLATGQRLWLDSERGRGRDVHLYSPPAVGCQRGVHAASALLRRIPISGTNYGLTADIPGTNGPTRCKGGYSRYSAHAGLSALGNSTVSNPFLFRDNRVHYCART